MTFSSHVDVSKTITIPQPIHFVRKYISSVEHMKECMPKVETLTQLKDNGYHCQYEALGPDGFKVPFSFSASLDIKDENTIAIKPIKRKVDNAFVKGHWQLEEQGEQTRATFKTETKLDVPLSRFLKMAADPIISKIFTNLMNKYVENIEAKIDKSPA